MVSDLSQETEGDALTEVNESESAAPTLVQSKTSTSNPFKNNAMAYVAEAVQKVGPAVIRIDTETDIERAV